MSQRMELTLGTAALRELPFAVSRKIQEALEEGSGGRVELLPPESAAQGELLP